MTNSKPREAAPVERGEARDLPPAEILDRLPENVRVSVIEAAFSGPLPPSSMFEHYEKTLPGSADRILKMAEKEQDNRAAWKTEALRSARGDVRRLQWLGAILAFVSIAGSVVLGIMGAQIVAGILAGITVIGLAGRYLIRNPR